MFLIEMFSLDLPKENYFSLTDSSSYFSVCFATFSLPRLYEIDVELDIILNSD